MRNPQEDIAATVSVGSALTAWLAQNFIYVQWIAAIVAIVAGAYAIRSHLRK